MSTASTQIANKYEKRYIDLNAMGVPPVAYPVIGNTPMPLQSLKMAITFRNAYTGLHRHARAFPEFKKYG